MVRVRVGLAHCGPNGMGPLIGGPSSCSTTARLSFCERIGNHLELLPHARTITVLRIALLGSGRTLREIASAVDTSQSTLSNVANGLYPPSDALLMRLSAYFGVDGARLMKPLRLEMPWLYERSSK